MIWNDCYIYPDSYTVSDSGIIKGKDRLVKNSRNDSLKIYKGRILKQYINNGYAYVRLSKKGKSKSFAVHRIVLFSFNKEADKTLEVNHIDANKLNNSLSNLEAVTGKENVQHAIKNNLIKRAFGEGTKKSKITNKIALEIIKLRKNKIEYKEISKKLGVSIKIIGDICRGRTWKSIQEKTIQD